MKPAVWAVFLLWMGCSVLIPPTIVQGYVDEDEVPLPEPPDKVKPRKDRPREISPRPLHQKVRQSGESREKAMIQKGETLILRGEALREKGEEMIRKGRELVEEGKRKLDNRNWLMQGRDRK